MSSSPERSGHEYDAGFYDYINSGSGRSASIICPRVVSWLTPVSLLDVGCGAGAWCKSWSLAGVADVVGVDGEYVNRSSLLIDPATFHPKDISRSFDMGRSFDLVTSLEVAEHIPAEHADTFVDNLTRHGDIVMFSAAVPGQGGEFHVNEQPLGYWRDRFRQRGYRCFDPLRSEFRDKREIEPWYRYNTLIYVNESRVGDLPQAISAHEVMPGDAVPDVSPLSWKMRNGMIRLLPEPARNLAVSIKHAWMRKQAG